MSNIDIKESAPLHSIRVFVEAGRQQNFSTAAQILGMTQSGVSHHIANLERHLGHRLFARRGNTLALTDAGRLYFETVQEAMSTLELATREFAPPTNDAGRLVVRTSLPTFAMNVLIPALPRFIATPAAAVDIVTSLSPPQAGEHYDVLISRDLSINDGGAHWRLVEEKLICIAAPAVHQRHASQAMSAWPFIATRSRPDTLVAWSGHQGLDARNIRIASSFEHYFLSIPAAIAGLGFLIVPRLLVANALQTGEVTEAPAKPVRSSANYRAFINPKSSAQKTAKTFCRWLVGELRTG